MKAKFQLAFCRFEGCHCKPGGRPDLARERALPEVVSPRLLIVGSLDSEVITLNKKAFQKLKCGKDIRIVDGTSHLFEEKGKLHIVSELATEWFEKYLVSSVAELS